MKYLLFLITCCAWFGVSAQEKKQILFYIRTYIEDVRSKFHSTFENQYRINFFKDKWDLHGFKRDVISFFYQSPKKGRTNEWSIPIKDDREYLIYRNYFTLEQFYKETKRAGVFSTHITIKYSSFYYMVQNVATK